MNLDNGSHLPRVVLLVEDSDNDAELTRLGLATACAAVELHHVNNGEECMDFLRRACELSDAPMPDLILLDLNMPRMDGREVLEEINRDARLRHLPVVVMTTSQAAADVLASYQLRCNSYVVKPVDFQAFIDVVRTLADYWFSLVALPTRLLPPVVRNKPV